MVEYESQPMSASILDQSKPAGDNLNEQNIIESLPKDEEIATFSKTQQLPVDSSSIPIIPEIDNPSHKEGCMKLTEEQVGTQDRLAAMLNMHRTHTYEAGADRRKTMPGGHSGT